MAIEEGEGGGIGFSGKGNGGGWLVYVFLNGKCKLLDSC